MKLVTSFVSASAATLLLVPSAVAQGGVTRFCTSGAAGSVISAAGSADFSAAGGSGDLVLHASNVPANRFGLFFFGNAAGAPSALGNGFLCVGGALLRLPTVQSQVGQPTVSFPVDYLAPQSLAGPMAPGSTWNFQFLFRDGASVDLSDAIGIHFGPPEPVIGFTTLLQSSKTGHPTGWLPEGGVHVVTDGASWSAFWSLHTQFSSPPPPPLAVDFTQSAVVAVFAGIRFSTGYGLNVRRLGLSIATIGVTSVERTPGNCGVFFTETQPLHFVIVPRVEHLALGAWTKVSEASVCP